MKKLTVIKTVNACLFLSFLVQALTGISLALHWGASLGEFLYELHEINGFIMIALVAAHIALFWPVVRQHYLVNRKR